MIDYATTIKFSEPIKTIMGLLPSVLVHSTPSSLLSLDIQQYLSCKPVSSVQHGSAGVQSWQGGWSCVLFLQHENQFSVCQHQTSANKTETFPLTILPLLLLLQIPIVVDLGLTLTKQLTAKKVNDDCVPHLPKVIMMELK